MNLLQSIRVPGSKSYTNRALIMAALAKGPVVLKNPLHSDDTEAMIDCLRTLGVDIQTPPNQIIVHGPVSPIADKSYQLSARDSGTTVRFLLALLCIVPGVKTIQGSKRLNERPITDLVDALQELGAQIEYGEKEGMLPVTVTTSSLSGNSVHLKSDLSSQFCSALLLISPYIPQGLTLHRIGPTLSKPYIEMTLRCMEEWGVKVYRARSGIANLSASKPRDSTIEKGASIEEIQAPFSIVESRELIKNSNSQFLTGRGIIAKENESYFVPAGQCYRKKEYVIEGDFSSAGYFFAIAALIQSTITVENLNPFSLQADRKFLDILAKMGNVITYGENEICVQGKQIIPLSVDMEDCPDQVMTLAVLAAFADGVTHISGVRSLRYKETERVLALKKELGKMGIKTEDTYDTLTIYGGSPHAAEIDTYNDHRMAMAFAVATMRLEGMSIRHPEVVNKTFPTFWEVLGSLR